MKYYFSIVFTLLLGVQFGMAQIKASPKAEINKAELKKASLKSTGTVNTSRVSANKAMTAVGAARLSAPFKSSVEISETTIDGSTRPVPGSGDAAVFRMRYSKFMVGDELPADFPEWDVATQTKEEYKEVVADWLRANKEQVKPEYHSHSVFNK